MRSGPCPRHQAASTVLSRSASWLTFTLLPVVLALILLPAIAFASPPDPSWIAGIYDAADGDDIVSLLYETSATSQTAPSQLGPLPYLLDRYLDGIAHTLPDRHFTRVTRSSPVLCSPEFVSLFNSLPPPTSFKSSCHPPVSREVLSLPVLRPEDESSQLILCPPCRFDNRASVSFCEECGARLHVACPSCGASSNPVAQREGSHGDS